MFGTARTVAVRYKAEVDGYVAGIRKMQAATSDFGKRASLSAKANSAEWDSIGTTAMTAGLAIGAGVAVAVKKAADFEQAMSRVGAVSGASAREMDALSDAALKAGEDTVFSATEAAAAQEELAKAGVSTADILGGALAGSLDLAAAGGLDLAKAAEISAQAMNLFNLEGSDVGHIADVLTAAANKSAAGVEDLGMALSQAGTVASGTGLTLEETAGTLAAFADNGMKGSDAGTSLKTMLQRLNPQSKEARDAMERLGIAAYDANGEFVGMEALAGQLQTGMANLTAEQRASAMQTIFGSDAVRAANILYKEGAVGIREYVAAVNDQGAAQRMAARMTDNLKGDLEGLAGALETAFIKTGSGGTESLRGLVQGLEGVVAAYNGLDKGTQSAIFNLAALSAGVLLVGGAAMKATTSIVAFRASLQTLGVTAGTTTKALAALRAAFILGAAGYVSTELKDWIVTSKMATVATDDLAASMEGLAKGGNLSGGIADLFRDQGGWLQAKEGIVTTTEALDRFSVVAKDAFGDDLHQKLARWSGNGAVAKFEQQVTQLDAALAAMVRNGNAKGAADAFDALMSNVDPSVVDETKAAFTEYQQALDETGPSAAGAREAVAGLDDALDSNQDGWVDATEAAEAHAEALKGVQDALTMLGGGFRAEQAAMRSVQESLTGIKDAAKDGAGWNELSAAMEKAADDALAYAGAQVEMGRGSETIAAGIQRVRDQVIESGVSAGKSRAFMEDYADAIGLIPEEARTLVEAAGVTESTAEVLALDASIVGLDGKVVTVKEEGANPSKGRVMELDGAIFGLDGKTVKVQEVGATPSGERVVRFQGKIYALRGKTVNVAATTSGESALRNLQGIINRMTGRTVNVHTQYTHSGTPVAMGVRRAQADGGILSGGHHGLVQAFANGGYVGSFATAHPQIRPAGGAGVLWAEEGAGPWEAFISGHPAKAERSRSIWLETGRRLGMIQAHADGGVASRHYVSAQPAPRVTVSAPASPAPSIDYNALGAAVARSLASMPTPAVTQRQVAEAVGGLLVKGRKAGWSSTEGAF